MEINNDVYIDQSERTLVMDQQEIDYGCSCSKVYCNKCGFCLGKFYHTFNKIVYQAKNQLVLQKNCISIESLPKEQESCYDNTMIIENETLAKSKLKTCDNTPINSPLLKTSLSLNDSNFNSKVYQQNAQNQVTNKECLGLSSSNSLSIEIPPTNTLLDSEGLICLINGTKGIESVLDILVNSQERLKDFYNLLKKKSDQLEELENRLEKNQNLCKKI